MHKIVVNTSAHLSRPLLIPHQANVLKEKVPNDGKDDRQRDGDQATAPKEETEHGEEGGDAVEDHQRGHQTDVVLLNAVEHQQVEKSADDCARPKTVAAAIWRMSRKKRYATHATITAMAAPGSVPTPMKKQTTRMTAVITCRIIKLDTRQMWCWAMP
ncbi:hypothetical protein TYRP_019526 [Tyrophagus putrescentiae]|nr:hypothetical protein TYRP_019526 [Tyrophagus putrescentiae]